MARVAGFLPCTWETWFEIPAPSFGPTQHRPLQSPLGEWMNGWVLSLFLISLPLKKYISKNFLKRHQWFLVAKSNGQVSAVRLSPPISSTGHSHSFFLNIPLLGNLSLWFALLWSLQFLCWFSSSPELSRWISSLSYSVPWRSHQISLFKCHVYCICNYICNPACLYLLSQKKSNRIPSCRRHLRAFNVLQCIINIQKEIVYTFVASFKQNPFLVMHLVRRNHYLSH